MLEVFRLDDHWAAELYKFLVANKDSGGVSLVGKRDVFLMPPNGLAIACTENKRLKQVLLCEFINNKAYTRGIIGSFGDYTVDVLDGLCAICSSNEPMIVDHEIVIIPKYVEDFKLVWSKSRLGRMTEESSWKGAFFFKATIKYPSL